MPSILLIEDDLYVRESTCELLEHSNYHVLTASDGKIGLELALRFRPDLILCDILMPDNDGFNVLSKLREEPQTSLIPFIFLSAQTASSEIKKGLDMGAQGYICKPFSESELLDAVNKVLNLTTS